MNENLDTRLSYHQKKSWVFLILCFLGVSSIKATDLVLTPIVSDAAQDKKVVFFMVEDGFDDILSMQFSIHWNLAAVSFEKVDVDFSGLPFLGASNFGAVPNNTDNGRLPFLWYDQNVEGISLPDGELLFSVTFEKIAEVEAMISITNLPFIAEIYDANGNPVNLKINNVQFSSLLSGAVFEDENDDCLYNFGELRQTNWTVKAIGNGRTFYARTNAEGQFAMPLKSGEYDFSLVSSELGYWESCQPSYKLILEQGALPLPLDIPIQKKVECPKLEVNLSTDYLSPCTNSRFQISYCNKGTLNASNAYIEIEFDNLLTILDSSIPWSSSNNNIYTFPLGNIESGFCGSFEVLVSLDCDVIEGQTHCTKAEIFPNDFCDASPNWSGAKVEVSSECLGNEVEFTIKNSGNFDMQKALNFIVIEDVVMHLDAGDATGDFQLNAGEEITFLKPANGVTWRLTTDQVDFHPGQSTPITTVEGCGTDVMGDFSLGYITPFSQDDGDRFRDFDCQENIAQSNPNYAIAFPRGLYSDHLINPNTEIEYLIRFQNTGTDTALNLVILDTLPPELNPGSIQPGAASHPYRFEMLEENIIQFYFQNISLPDSMTNNVASQGFVKFRIAQVPDLPLNTRIENSFSIYFDLKDPISTPKVFHTIGKNFLEILDGTVSYFIPGLALTIAPNPVADKALFQLEGATLLQSTFRLFDQTGRLSQQLNFDGNQFYFYKNNLPSGLYVFQILSEKGLVSTGKIIIN
ncbi:MAG: T9SS type A sorting domain-containing protein [Bacteroidetes bacterium]|jgi:uncharacterized repeat protein (TIGR01451 family)|nr:T9SS type A sorting domain-containing protein [Bacteroidota bacterium]